jgi:hypothetical protein
MGLSSPIGEAMWSPILVSTVSHVSVARLEGRAGLPPRGEESERVVAVDVDQTKEALDVVIRADDSGPAMRGDALGDDPDQSQAAAVDVRDGAQVEEQSVGSLPYGILQGATEPGTVLVADFPLEHEEWNPSHTGSLDVHEGTLSPGDPPGCFAVVYTVEYSHTPRGSGEESVRIA